MKALLGLAGTLLAALIILSGPAVWWLDRRPLGSPPLLHWHVLFWSANWPGDSLYAQGQRAGSDLKQCRVNEAAQSAAMARQEAAVQALAAEGQRRTANASAAVQQAQARAVGRDAEIAAIRNVQALGPDLCSDALAVIHAVPQ